MKKPGEFKRARLRHLRRQSNSDSLKALHEGTVEAIVTLPYQGKMTRFRVRMFEPLAIQPYGEWVIARTKRGLQVGQLAHKDGWTFFGEHITFKGPDVLASVIGREDGQQL